MKESGGRKVPDLVSSRGGRVVSSRGLRGRRRRSFPHVDLDRLCD